MVIRASLKVAAWLAIFISTPAGWMQGAWGQNPRVYERESLVVTERRLEDRPIVIAGGVLGPTCTERPIGGRVLISDRKSRRERARMRPSTRRTVMPTTAKRSEAGRPERRTVARETISREDFRRLERKVDALTRQNNRILDVSRDSAANSLLAARRAEDASRKSEATRQAVYELFRATAKHLSNVRDGLKGLSGKLSGLATVDSVKESASFTRWFLLLLLGFLIVVAAGASFLVALFARRKS